MQSRRIILQETSHRSPLRAAPPAQTSLLRSLNARLSTLNSQFSYFTPLRTPSHLLENSPLCFHTLTHSFAPCRTSTPTPSSSSELFGKNTRVGGISIASLFWLHCSAIIARKQDPRRGWSPCAAPTAVGGNTCLSYTEISAIVSGSPAALFSWACWPWCARPWPPKRNSSFPNPSTR